MPSLKVQEMGVVFGGGVVLCEVIYVGVWIP